MSVPGTNVRIMTEPLGGSALSRIIQLGESPLDWVASRPTSAAQWRARAVERAGESHWAAQWETLAPAFSATGAAWERLERVRLTGGVVVTTGQQPGLFGGPVYTWSKAMGALALADAIQDATGIATAAVFWAATDDADFVEASYTVLAGTGGAEVLRSEHAPLAGTPMSLAPLGDMTPLLARLRDATGSAADPRALAAVGSAYGDPAQSVGGAYVALLRELLAPLGMPVLDASHEAVRAASDPTLRAALRHAVGIGRALEARDAEIGARGLDVQVESVAGLSLVFSRDGAIKRRLSIAEAGRAAEGREEYLTPNVLLRPIVEQALLPTVAYVGGPGELAYFAQATAVADVLEVRRPLAVPRWSCTMIEPHVEHLLSRFGIVPDALARPDLLEGIVARAAMSDGSSTALRALRETIDAMPDALGAESHSLGLTAAVQGAVQSLQHRVDRLERRLVAGIKRREHGLLRDVGTLRAALYPRGTRQERALNITPMLSRHGLALLSEMRDASRTHAQSLIGGADAQSASATA